MPREATTWGKDGERLDTATVHYREQARPESEEKDMQTTEITASYQGTCYCGKPVTVGWISKDSDGDYWRHDDRSHITDECVPVRYWENIKA